MWKSYHTCVTLVEGLSQSHCNPIKVNGATGSKPRLLGFEPSMLTSGRPGKRSNYFKTSWVQTKSCVTKQTFQCREFGSNFVSLLNLQILLTFGIMFSKFPRFLTVFVCVFL